MEFGVVLLLLYLTRSIWLQVFAAAARFLGGSASSSVDEQGRSATGQGQEPEWLRQKRADQRQGPATVKTGPDVVGRPYSDPALVLPPPRPLKATNGYAEEAVARDPTDEGGSGPISKVRDTGIIQEGTAQEATSSLSGSNSAAPSNHSAPNQRPASERTRAPVQRAEGATSRPGLRRSGHDGVTAAGKLSYPELADRAIQELLNGANVEDLKALWFGKGVLPAGLKALIGSQDLSELINASIYLSQKAAALAEAPVPSDREQLFAMCFSIAAEAMNAEVKKRIPM